MSIILNKIKHRKIFLAFLTISVLLAFTGIVSLFRLKLGGSPFNLNPDFTGETAIFFEFPIQVEKENIDDISKVVSSINGTKLTSIQVDVANGKNVLLKTTLLSERQLYDLTELLRDVFSIKKSNFFWSQNTAPTISLNLIKLYVLAFTVFVLIIMIYTLIRFGISSVVAIIITTAMDIFASLGVCTITKIAFGEMVLVSLFIVALCAFCLNIAMLSKMKCVLTLTHRNITMLDVATNSIWCSVSKRIMLLVPAVVIIIGIIYSGNTSLLGLFLPATVGLALETCSSVLITPTVYVKFECMKKHKNNKNAKRRNDCKCKTPKKK